ncbi:MAG: hypothetical protein SOU84_00920 [Candidatus Faecimonas sp.]|nr:hypothetical protein [Mycoplasmatota bacterium]MDY2907713.1 hypothetical protein [Candidatus Faecimonas sp.]
MYQYDTSDANSFYQKFMKLIENKESYSVLTKLLDAKEYGLAFMTKDARVDRKYILELIDTIVIE